MVDPHQADPETRRRVSGPGFRAFIAIADRWGLSEDERLRVLGLAERAVYDDWIARARERRELTLSLDVLLRISGVLGVYKALFMLYGDDVAETVAWLRGPHGAQSFGGQPPLASLADGTLEGILRVRRYLDWYVHNG